MNRARKIVTRRLVIRPWHPSDAPALKEAIDASLDHLRPWMSWAHDEPTPVEALAERLRRFRRRFLGGGDGSFGLFDEAADGPEDTSAPRVLGAAGMHRRIGAGAFEIGYWIRAGRTGAGLATEAAAALTRLGFQVGGARLLEIHCDPANIPSFRVAERIGYTLTTTVPNWLADPRATPRDTMFWRMHAKDWPASPAAAASASDGIFDRSGQPLTPEAATAD